MLYEALKVDEPLAWRQGREHKQRFKDYLQRNGQRSKKSRKNMTELEEQGYTVMQDQEEGNFKKYVTATSNSE